MDDLSSILFSGFGENNYSSNFTNSLCFTLSNDSLEFPLDEADNILNEPHIITSNPNSFQNSPIQPENILNEQSPEINEANTNHNQNINQNQKKKLGRKRKNEISEETNEGKHTKKSEDNMIRKIKRLLKDSLLDIINSEIQEITKENNLIVEIKGKKYEVKQLLNIDPKQIKDISVEGNKNLLNKNLEEFFSVDIASNYSKFPKCFNKVVIDKLKKNKNNKKLIKIFEMTFWESLKIYRNDKEVEKNSCLEKLKNDFNDLPKTLKEKDKSNTDDYINDLIYLIKDFENFFDRKAPRKRRKQD